MKTEMINRAAIVSAAKEIVSAEGTAGLTIRGVAAKCHVAVGTLYRYYPNKDALLSDVIEHFWREAFGDEKETFAIRGEMDFGQVFHLFYKKAASALSKFETTFLADAALMHSSQQEGRMHEHAYFLHIRSLLHDALLMDRRIRKDAFDEVLTIDAFLNVIVRTALTELRLHHEPDVLLHLIRRVLYEGETVCRPL